MSFLSSNAKSLLLYKITQPADKLEVHSNAESFIIDFENLDEKITHLLSVDCFNEALMHITPLLNSRVRIFRTYSTAQLATKFSHMFNWLSDPAEFLELHTRLPCFNPVDRVLVMLRLSSMFEFSLGRLYWTPERKCANTMKCMLKSSLLAEVCGRNCLLLIRLFCGPVTSLNLRNLFWHGFVSPNDAAQMDDSLIFCFFILILSIGDRLSGRLPKLTRPSYGFILHCLDALHIPASLNYFASLKKSLDGCQTGISSILPYVQYIEHLAMMSPKRNLDILCISLVCLSVILRCEFADVCGWSDAIQTSEDRFFLTLDNILEFRVSKTLCRPVSADQYSEFAERLSDRRVLAVLCDLLSAEHGPRLKDHLSHGELWFTRSSKVVGDTVEIESIDVYFEKYVSVISACLVTLLSGRSSDPAYRTQAVDWLDSYTLRFHPTALCLIHLTKLTNSLSTLTGLLPNAYASVCVDEVNSKLNQVIPVWFPNQPDGLLTIHEESLSSHLWFILTSWVLLPAECQSNWSGKPAALLHRLNLLLGKYLEATNHLITFVDERSNVELTVNISSRKRATAERLQIALPYYCVFLLWLLNFIHLSWYFWLGGHKDSVLNRAHCIIKHSTNLTVRAKLLDYLEKAGDKLLMWVSKCKWDSVSSFIRDIKLPGCK
ncbi:hypothetical protein EG68_09154 [Paragonimus skrjabini miyazakii]|uniref:DUF4209 domain-containing protein n=1 Tax=Paragonimus skrjabini miyazakii TaxID=59628 RepID=A0A8S9YRP7_9TREM|nr:hypothetical protein EG68_09154 [Paragonimus skrjabini miyazakii]